MAEAAGKGACHEGCRRERRQVQLPAAPRCEKATSVNTDPRVRDLAMAVLFVMGIAALLMWLAMPAHATQPQCTGDRHYDSEANGCCPNVSECPEPEECDVCKPVLPCPEPAPCPSVTCECANGTSQIVYVDRCPQPEVSEVCKVRRDGTVVCPRSKKARRHGNGARRILVPQSIIDQIADVAKY